MGRLSPRLTLVAALVITFAYFPAQWNGNLAYLVTNWLPIFLALAAIAFGVFTVWKSGMGRQRFSFVWVLICGTWLGYLLGMFLRFISQLLWAFEPLVRFPRKPSVADLFWVASFFPLFIALILQAYPFRKSLHSKVTISTIFTTLVMAAILAGFVVPLINAISDPLSQSLALTYLVFDLSLFCIIVPVASLFARGTFWRPFLLVMLGFILNLVGDAVYAWANLVGTYYAAHPLNLLYHWSYLLVVLGFYERFTQNTKPNVSPAASVIS